MNLGGQSQTHKVGDDRKVRVSNHAETQEMTGASNNAPHANRSLGGGRRVSGDGGGTKIEARERKPACKRDNRKARQLHEITNLTGRGQSVNQLS